MMIRRWRTAGVLTLSLGLCAAGCGGDRKLGALGTGGLADAGGSGGLTTGSGADGGTDAGASADAGTDPVKEAQKATLDSCGLPVPCPAATLTVLSSFDYVTLNCLVNSLALGGAMHLSYADVGDGGGHWCDSVHEIYVGQDRSVLLWSRTDTDCSASFDYMYGLERCTLQDEAYFTGCTANDKAGGPNTCGGVGMWVTGCVSVDVATCP